MLIRFLLVLVLLGSASALAADKPDGPTLPDLMKQQGYLSAWNAMLVNETVPDWVTRFATTLDGPSIPVIEVPVLSEKYTLAFTCKAHDCGDNQVYVLFAPGARDAWGMLIEEGKVRWLGEPDSTVQQAILDSVE